MLTIVTESILISDSKLFTCAFSRFKHLSCLCSSLGHRLFTHHVFTCFKRCNCNLRVRIIGRTYVNNINTPILEQFTIIAIHLCPFNTIILSCFCCTFFHDIAKSNELSIRLFRKARQMFPCSYTSATNNSNLQCFRHG
ncbi:hypothetical protein D3C76_930900 [compost metagenome]